MHPGEQPLVTGPVGLADAHRILKGSLDLAVQAPDPSCLSVGGSAGAERRDRQPPGGARQPSEWILPVGGMLIDPGHGGRMQGLHQQCPDAADERC
jgi:hypothetical protein